MPEPKRTARGAMINAMALAVSVLVALILFFVLNATIDPLLQ